MAKFERLLHGIEEEFTEWCEHGKLHIRAELMGLRSELAGEKSDGVKSITGYLSHPSEKDVGLDGLVGTLIVVLMRSGAEERERGKGKVQLRFDDNCLTVKYKGEAKTFYGQKTGPLIICGESKHLSHDFIVPPSDLTVGRTDADQLSKTVELVKYIRSHFEPIG